MPGPILPVPVWCAPSSTCLVAAFTFDASAAAAGVAVTTSAPSRAVQTTADRGMAILQHDLSYRGPSPARAEPATSLEGDRGAEAGWLGSDGRLRLIAGPKKSSRLLGDEYPPQS